MRGTKKVVILNKVKSPLISQAIFILKDEVENEFSALSEAERIVDEYIFGTKEQKKSKVYISAITVTAVTSIMLFLYFYLKF